jgi:hypothetical protein
MDSNDLVSEALISDEISLNIITNGVCQREKWLLIPAFDELGDIDDDVLRWALGTAHARLNRCARRPPWAGSFRPPGHSRSASLAPLATLAALVGPHW